MPMTNEEKRKLTAATEVRTVQDLVMHDICRELDRQIDEWGVQNHDPVTWIAILAEEVGEAARVALEMRPDRRGLGDYTEEMVQVAAVAVAAIECVQRQRFP